MLRFCLLALLASLVAAPAATAAEAPAGPTVASYAADANGFVPAGWQIERQATGDLNRDGRPDLALILIDPDPVHFEPRGRDAFEMLSAGNPRILAIAFAGTESGYRLALADALLLPRRRRPNGLSEGFMLFEDGSLAIDRGRLRITFQYTRAHTDFVFRWQDGRFRLIGYDSAGVSGGCLHAVSANFLARRAKLTAGYVDRDKEQVRWTKLPRRPLLAMADIGEGEALDPEGLVSGFPLSCGER